MGAGNLWAAGTCPGTHSNDLLQHSGPTQLPKQSCRHRDKSALRDDGTHYFDLDVQNLTAGQVSMPPHWTAEGTCLLLPLKMGPSQLTTPQQTAPG